MKKWLGLLALVMSMSGCATRYPEIKSPFDAQHTANSLEEDGQGGIVGNAFLTQRDGDAVTCAGKVVLLFPVTPRSKEYAQAVYGDEDAGFVYYVNAMNRMDRSDPVLTTARRTRCDVRGDFEFENVRDGDFYVQTSSYWMIDDYHYEGGWLMSKVSIRHGKVKKIVLGS